MIHNERALTDHGNAAAREVLLDVCERALDRIHPRTEVPAAVQVTDEHVRVDGTTYDRAAVDDVYVIGAGKGSAAVVAVLREVLGDVVTDGVVVEKEGQARPIPGVEVREAGHPLPNEDGRRAAERVLDLARTAGEDDLAFVCITGGASALLPAPADDITVEELATLTERLLDGGLPIDEINTVRKHVSDIKGGQLAERLHPATTVTLVVVDEVAGEPWGPTVPDETTAADAIDVLRRRGLWTRTPESIRRRLERVRRDAARETPTGAAFDVDETQTVVLADAADVCEAAAASARELGFDSLILSSCIEGESRTVGTVLAGIAKEVHRHGRPVEPPCVVVSGGETTVTVGDAAGQGGPNQELAVQFAVDGDGLTNATLLALGTDGTDGPTAVAGGLVDGRSADRARRRDLDLHEYLARHDSTSALERLDDVVYTGPTGTNVMDLRLLLMDSPD